MNTGKPWRCQRTHWGRSQSLYEKLKWASLLAGFQKEKMEWTFEVADEVEEMKEKNGVDWSRDLQHCIECLLIIEY